MSEEEDNDDCCACDCCSKRPISFLIVFIIILDSIGIIMNVLMVVFTHWKYVKFIFFILTFVSLFFLCVVLGFDITVLALKRHLYKNNKKYVVSKAFSLCILVINPLTSLLNIFLAIFISIQLHIADFPEYGGRERDQEYIDSHPDEFGSVSSGEFIVAAMCPAMAAITQFACMFFSIALFRRVYYLPESYGNERNQINVVATIDNPTNENRPIGYQNNLKISRTDDRLYPNKKNLPKDLKYENERVFEEINNEAK